MKLLFPERYYPFKKEFFKNNDDTNKHREAHSLAYIETLFRTINFLEKLDPKCITLHNDDLRRQSVAIIVLKTLFTSTQTMLRKLEAGEKQDSYKELTSSIDQLNRQKENFKFLVTPECPPSLRHEIILLLGQLGWRILVDHKPKDCTSRWVNYETIMLTFLNRIVTQTKEIRFHRESYTLLGEAIYRYRTLHTICNQLHEHYLERLKEYEDGKDLENLPITETLELIKGHYRLVQALQSYALHFQESPRLNEETLKPFKQVFLLTHTIIAQYYPTLLNHLSHIHHTQIYHEFQHLISQLIIIITPHGLKDRNIKSLTFTEQHLLEMMHELVSIYSTQLTSSTIVRTSFENLPERTAPILNIREIFTLNHHLIIHHGNNESAATFTMLTRYIKDRILHTANDIPERTLILGMWFYHMGNHLSKLLTFQPTLAFEFYKNPTAHINAPFSHCADHLMLCAQAAISNFEETSDTPLISYQLAELTEYKFNMFMVFASNACMNHHFNLFHYYIEKAKTLLPELSEGTPLDPSKKEEIEANEAYQQGDLAYQRWILYLASGNNRAISHMKLHMYYHLMMQEITINNSHTLSHALRAIYFEIDHKHYDFARLLIKKLFIKTESTDCSIFSLLLLCTQDQITEWVDSLEGKSTEDACLKNARYYLRQHTSFPLAYHLFLKIILSYCDQAIQKNQQETLTDLLDHLSDMSGNLVIKLDGTNSWDLPILLKLYVSTIMDLAHKHNVSSTKKEAYLSTALNTSIILMDQLKEAIDSSSKLSYFPIIASLYQLTLYLEEVIKNKTYDLKNDQKLLIYDAAIVASTNIMSLLSKLDIPSYMDFPADALEYELLQNDVEARIQRLISIEDISPTSMFTYFITSIHHSTTTEQQRSLFKDILEWITHHTKTLQSEKKYILSSFQLLEQLQSVMLPFWNHDDERIEIQKSIDTLHDTYYHLLSPYQQKKHLVLDLKKEKAHLKTFLPEEKKIIAFYDLIHESESILEDLIKVFSAKDTEINTYNMLTQKLEKRRSVLEAKKPQSNSIILKKIHESLCKELKIIINHLSDIKQYPLPLFKNPEYIFNQLLYHAQKTSQDIMILLSQQSHSPESKAIIYYGAMLPYHLYHTMTEISQLILVEQRFAPLKDSAHLMTKIIALPQSRREIIGITSPTLLNHLTQALELLTSSRQDKITKKEALEATKILLKDIIESITTAYITQLEKTLNQYKTSSGKTSILDEIFHLYFHAYQLFNTVYEQHLFSTIHHQSKEKKGATTLLPSNYTYLELRKVTAEFIQTLLKIEKELLLHKYYRPDLGFSSKQDYIYQALIRFFQLPNIDIFLDVTTALLNATTHTDFIFVAVEFLFNYVKKHANHLIKNYETAKLIDTIQRFYSSFIEATERLEPHFQNEITMILEEYNPLFENLTQLISHTKLNTNIKIHYIQNLSATNSSGLPETLETTLANKEDTIARLVRALNESTIDEMGGANLVDVLRANGITFNIMPSIPNDHSSPPIHVIQLPEAEQYLNSKQPGQQSLKHV